MPSYKIISIQYMWPTTCNIDTRSHHQQQHSCRDNNDDHVGSSTMQQTTRINYLMFLFVLFFAFRLQKTTTIVTTQPLSPQCMGCSPSALYMQAVEVCMLFNLFPMMATTYSGCCGQHSQRFIIKWMNVRAFFYYLFVVVVVVLIQPFYSVLFY